MFVLLAASAVASEPTRQRGTASVRIVEPATATREEFEAAPPTQKRVIIIKNKDGRLFKVEVIDFQ